MAANVTLTLLAERKGARPMDVQTAQQIARDDIDARRIQHSSAFRYARAGRYLIGALRSNGCTVDYAGLVQLAGIQGIAKSTFDQRAPALRYAMAITLIEAGNEMASAEVDELARGIIDLSKPRAGAARHRPAGRMRDGDISRRALRPAQRYARKYRGYADWRADLVDHARPADRPLIRLQAVCGCRPDEIHAGVQVTARADGALVIRIEGSKCDADEFDAAGEVAAYGRKGQPWRELTLQPTGDRLFDELRAEVDAAGGEAVYTFAGTGGDYPVANYCKRVRTLTKRLGYSYLGAYSLRHQFGADCKAAGADVERLAQALGHRTTRSQQVYGQGRTGRRGMVWLEAARAARPVIDRGLAESIENTIRRREKEAAEPETAPR